MVQNMKMTREELEEVKTIKWQNTWRWQRKIVFDKCTTWRGFHTKSIQTDCTSEAESIFAVFLVQQGLFYSYAIPDVITLLKFLIHITCVGGHIEGLVWWTTITVLDKKPSCFQGSCVFFFALCYSEVTFADFIFSRVNCPVIHQLWTE